MGLDYMVLRDGKKLDTTPGKATLPGRFTPRNTPFLRGQLFLQSRYPQQQEVQEQAGAAVEGGSRFSIGAAALPVARFATSLRMATGTISARLFGSSSSSSSASGAAAAGSSSQSASSQNQEAYEAADADVNEPSIEIQGEHPASPFDDDDHGMAADDRDQEVHYPDLQEELNYEEDLFDDQAQQEDEEVEEEDYEVEPVEDDDLLHTPPRFTRSQARRRGLEEHQPLSATPTLEESERRWIRNVAAWTSRYGSLIINSSHFL
jgi:hypothetical protein